MNPALRLIAVPPLALVVAAGCGSSQKVNSAGPAARPAAVQAKTSTKAPTTTLPPAPVITSMSDLVALGGASSPVRGSIKINGTVYENAGAWEFDLSRSYKKLTAVIGVDDGAVSTDQVTVKLLADGNAIGQASTQLGKPVPIEVNLENVLRLRVEFSRNSTTCVAETGYSTNAAFADGKLTK